MNVKDWGGILDAVGVVEGGAVLQGRPLGGRLTSGHVSATGTLKLLNWSCVVAILIDHIHTQGPSFLSYE